MSPSIVRAGAASIKLTGQLRQPDRFWLFSKTVLGPSASEQSLRTPIVQHCVGQPPPNRRAPVAKRALGQRCG
jgi:hypothetical protein